MKKITVIVAAVFSLFAIGCKKDKAAVNLDDYTGDWGTFSLEAAGEQQPVVASVISIEKKSDTVLSVNGNSGVNSFFGDFVLSGGTVKASDNMGSTKMAGSPEAMEFEDKFLVCVSSADNIAVVKDEEKTVLEITNSVNGLKLTLVKNLLK